MAVMGDPFLAPRSNPDLILAAIRQQLFYHRGAGRQNVVAFQEAFTAWDGDGDERLSHFEFEKALGRCGVFLPAQEVNALFRQFDTRGDGHADTQEALTALRVPLNERRLAMVTAVFSSIAGGAGADAGSSGGGDGAAVAAGAATDRVAASVADGDCAVTDGPAARCVRDEKAAVPLSEALARMKSDAHPEVIAGRLDPQQVEEDFREFFTSRARAGASSSSVDGQGRLEATAVATEPGGAAVLVTLEGFMEYYRDVGVCEPYDTVFVPTMEALWGVQEPRPKEDTHGELTRLLQPKLLQHSHHAETPAEVFRKTLRYYHLDTGGSSKHGGLVNASGVERALNSFGLYPDKKEIEGIFAAVGSLPGAPGEVDRVVSFLCPPEPAMAPMF